MVDFSATNWLILTKILTDLKMHTIIIFSEYYAVNVIRNQRFAIIRKKK